MKTIIFFASALLFSAITSAQTNVSARQATSANVSSQADLQPAVQATTRAAAQAKSEISQKIEQTSAAAEADIPVRSSASLSAKQDNKLAGSASLKSGSATGTKSARVRHNTSVSTSLTGDFQPNVIRTSAGINSGLRIGL